MKYIKQFESFDENSLDIDCIGYKKKFGPGGPGTGDPMWYYKLNMNGKEYLIVDAGMLRLLSMVWTDQNKFENASGDRYDISYDFLDNQIVKAVENAEKKGEELGTDEEKTFFKQHKIKEPEPVVIPDREDGIYTDDEVNNILDILDHEFDFMYTEGVYKKITQEVADWANENGHDKLFDELVGYKFKVKSEGDHRNDGQMVDYYFTFKSPSGEKTKFETEMCLMVGWNYHQNLKIK